MDRQTNLIRNLLAMSICMLGMAGGGACMAASPKVVLSHRAQADQFLYRSELLKLEYVGQGRVKRLIKELRSHDYAGLEADLDKLNADFNLDPAYELAYQDTIYGFVGCNAVDMTLEGDMQAWVAARSKSAWSHLALGMYYQAEGCHARGEGWASEVTDAQWKQMNDYLAGVGPELEKAKRLNPKLPPIYWTLIVLAKMRGDLDAAYAAMISGRESVPRSYLVAVQYIDGLSPRWLGSYEQMDEYAKSMLPYLDMNPRYWDLQGYADAEKAKDAYRSRDFNMAITYYRLALNYADNRDWLVFAAESERILGHYGVALHYYQRNARYERPPEQESIDTENSLIAACRNNPAVCRIEPKDYPWYEEPGARDPADIDPLK